jgi:O-antigen/teichoic acid export membrane protein
MNAEVPAKPSDSTATRSELREGLLAFGAIFLNQGVSALAGALVAAFLDPARLGVVMLARTLVSLLPICCSLGLESGLQRHLGGAGSELPKRLAQVRLLRAFTFALSLLIVLALALGGAWLLEGTVFRYESFSLALTLTALGLPFATDLAVLGGAYRGMHLAMTNIVAQWIVQPLARIFAVSVCLVLGQAFLAYPLGVAFGYFAGWVLLASLAIVNLSTAVTAWRSVTFGELKPVLTFSIPLSMTATLTLLTRSLDLLVLGYFRTPTELGHYSVVLLLTQLIGLTGWATGQTVGARVAAAHALGNVAKIKVIHETNMKIAAVICAPLVACLVYWGDRVDLLLGEAYRLDWRVFGLCAAAAALMGVMGNLGNALRMTGYHNIELRLIAGGLVSQAIGCMILIPTWGQVGAATASLVAALLIWLAHLWMIHDKFDTIVFTKKVAYPFLTALALAQTVFLIETFLAQRSFLSTAICCLLVTIIYFAALPLTARLYGIARTLGSFGAEIQPARANGSVSSR